MNEISEIVTWAALGMIGYVYVGYPALLILLSYCCATQIRKAEIQPSVSLIISAFNEERVIERKLQNSLELNYPKDLLQILVVSDASTDETEELVKKFESQGVLLLRMPERRGKTVGLNAAVQIAQGEIVMFSDANILYDRETLQELVKSFADPLVGCVTGDSQYSVVDQAAADAQEKVYWKFERLIRAAESRVGSTVGGDGAIFAVRKHLFSSLDASIINDFVTPLQIVSKGFRAVFEPRAIGYERSAGSFAGEFRRKRRIVNRSWSGLLKVSEVLNPRRVGLLFAWQVWSHKLLRWLVLPFFLIGMMGAVFSYSLGLSYHVLVWGWVMSLLMAMISWMFPRWEGVGSKVMHGVLYFYTVNVAATLGIATAVMGEVETTWLPER